MEIALKLVLTNSNIDLTKITEKNYNETIPEQLYIVDNINIFNYSKDLILKCYSFVYNNLFYKCYFIKNNRENYWVITNQNNYLVTENVKEVEEVDVFNWHIYQKDNLLHLHKLFTLDNKDVAIKDKKIIYQCNKEESDPGNHYFNFCDEYLKTLLCKIVLEHRQSSYLCIDLENNNSIIYIENYTLNDVENKVELLNHINYNIEDVINFNNQLHRIIDKKYDELTDTYNYYTNTNLILNEVNINNYNKELERDNRIKELVEATNILVLNAHANLNELKQILKKD